MLKSRSKSRNTSISKSTISKSKYNRTKVSSRHNATITPATTTKPAPHNPLLATPLNRIRPPLTKKNKTILNIIHLPRCSPLMMLHLEERLLRHDPLKRNFAILNRPLPHHNSVILGISGKPNELVNCDLANQDGIPLIKRFTGGGTVYTTSDVRFVGLIVNKADVGHIDPYPTPVMKWTAELYEDCIDHLRESSKTEFQKFHKPRQEDELYFSLYENDYCLGSLRAIEENTSVTDPTITNSQQKSIQVQTDQTPSNQEHSSPQSPVTPTALKFAGNAQSFIRERFLHHTSILWDLDIENISKYLTLPSKRPAYRQNRSHRDFLTDLRPLFDIKSKEQNIDYFDDFKQEDEGRYLGGCEYTESFTLEKNKLLALKDQSGTLSTEFFSRPNPVPDQDGNIAPAETQRVADEMKEYKEQKAELEHQMALLQFPNLFAYFKGHQEQYDAHSAMLKGMGGVDGADKCQFNDSMIKALDNHFDLNFVTLDDLKDIIDLGDGALGTYIISSQPH